MEHLIGRLHSFLTGGQSDFLIPLSYQWHGWNVAPALYAVAAIGWIGALFYLGKWLWSIGDRRRPVSALSFAAMLLYATAAYAASSTLGNLSAGTTITDTDLFYDVQSVGTGGVKVTGAQLKAYAGTTVQTGAGATGGTCSPGSTCTIQTLETPVVRTSGNYTTSDRAELIQYNSASDQSPTLPSASSMGAGGVIDTCSIQHSQTITPNSGIPDTIGGASTYSLATGTAAAPTCVRLISNGVSDWKPTFVPGGSVTLAGNNVWTGVNDFTSTTTSTPAAGHTQLLGTASLPTMGANAEGWMGLSATNGLELMGQGSSNDVSIFDHAGAIVAYVNGNNWVVQNGFFALGTVQSQSSSGLQQVTSANSLASSFLLNQNAGNAAQIQWQWQNNNATPIQGTITLNGDSFSGGLGADAFAINGVTSLFLQGGGNNALKFASSGAATIYNQPTSGTIAYAVCAAANANGATGGALILDTSATVCGLSSMDFKRGIAAFSPSEMERLKAVTPLEDLSHLASVPAKVDPVAEVMAMIPGEYQGDGKNIMDTSPQFGFFAQDMCAIDKRLCIRDSDTGKPRNFRDRGVLALLVAVVQKQQAEIEDLKRRVH